MVYAFLEEFRTNWQHRNWSVVINVIFRTTGVTLPIFQSVGTRPDFKVRLMTRHNGFCNDDGSIFQESCDI